MRLLCRMPRPDRQAGEAEPAQDLADRALVQPDREPRPDQGLEVHPSPAHHAVPLRVRPPLDGGRQLGLLLGGEPWPRPRAAPVAEAIEPLLVVPMHPVAQGLPVHAGRPRRLLPRGPLQHQRRGEHPPRRPRVPAPARLPSQLARAQLPPRDRHRHGPSPPIGYTADQRPQAAHGATGPTVRSRGRWYQATDARRPHLPGRGELPATGTRAGRRGPRELAGSEPPPEHGRPQGAEEAPAPRGRLTQPAGPRATALFQNLTPPPDAPLETPAALTRGRRVCERTRQQPKDEPGL